MVDVDFPVAIRFLWLALSGIESSHPFQHDAGAGKLFAVAGGVDADVGGGQGGVRLNLRLCLLNSRDGTRRFPPRFVATAICSI